ncbi:hypothetical protein ACLOJK_038834 [Asimina triloba]
MVEGARRRGLHVRDARGGDCRCAGSGVGSWWLDFFSDWWPDGKWRCFCFAHGGLLLFITDGGDYCWWHHMGLLLDGMMGGAVGHRLTGCRWKMGS